MDCTAAAANLKKLLVAHATADAQISVLDAQISEIGQQSLVASALDGKRSQDLHLSLRLSVCEGIRIMYQNYQNKKWAQVQETARSIIENLEGDIDQDQTLPSSPVGTTNKDRTADKWSMAYCVFYRDN